MTDENVNHMNQPQTPSAAPTPPQAGPTGQPAAGGTSRSWFARNRGSMIVLGVAIIVTIAIAAIVMSHKRPVVPPAVVPPVNVEVIVIQPRDKVTDLFDLPGVVEPNVVVKVAAEVPGRVEAYGVLQPDSASAAAAAATMPAEKPVTKVQAATSQTAGAEEVQGDSKKSILLSARTRYLDDGDRVFAGQVLMRLNTDLITAERDQVKATLELDQRDLESVEKLNERGVSAKHELDQARSKRDISKALLDLAEARLKRATIVAPITGVIDRLPIEVGEYVQPGTIVAQIADLEKVKIVTDVPEKDAKFLHEGQDHLILLDLENNQSADPASQTVLTGTITYLSSVGDSQTRTKRLELTVDNPMGKNSKRPLQSQQIVRVRLTRRILTDAIMIPLLAVIPMQKEQDVFMKEVGIMERQTFPSMTVYVNDNGVARQREIRIGIIKGMSVSVVDGLKPGDRLIIAGQRQVAPGQSVTETAVRTSAPNGRESTDTASAAGN